MKSLSHTEKGKVRQGLYQLIYFNPVKSNNVTMVDSAFNPFSECPDWAMKTREA